MFYIGHVRTIKIEKHKYRNKSNCMGQDSLLFLDMELLQTD